MVAYGVGNPIAGRDFMDAIRAPNGASAARVLRDVSRR
jgi:hypothetical protein